MCGLSRRELFLLSYKYEYEIGWGQVGVAVSLDASKTENIWSEPCQTRVETPEHELVSVSMGVCERLDMN